MINNVSIIGMGALGLMYGDVLTKALGKDAVSFVLNSERVKSYEGRRFTCNGEAKSFKTVSENEAAQADLVIVAVKYNSLSSAIKTMKNCVGKDTIILSVLNGITSEKIIAKAYGSQRILFTVAQGMDAMRFGDDLTYEHMGNLHIGVADESQEPLLKEVTEFFERTSMPHIVEKDILHRMWCKFMLNVGVNQVCAAFRTDYAGSLAKGEANDTMIGAMRETIALAGAEGVQISEEDFRFYIDLLGTLEPTAIPSMAQDVVAGRKTEVDMFAGTVIEMSRKHNLSTPANEYLYKKTKEIEAEL